MPLLRVFVICETKDAIDVGTETFGLEEGKELEAVGAAVADGVDAEGVVVKLATKMGRTIVEVE